MSVTASHLFLNCTINAELTPAYFDRTVSFAPHRKTSSSSPERHRRSNSRHSGQRVMKVTDWKTYRTRFLVKAKQLNSSLSFTDHLGRQHCGRKGDYLVESYDGVISIAPRRIFEDIYVAMPGGDLAGDDCSSSKTFEPGEVRPLDLPTVRVEPLAIERIKPAAFEYATRDSAVPRYARTRRKSPMPVPSTAARARLM